MKIDMHHIHMRRNSDEVVPVEHAKHMMLHSSPDQFKEKYGEEEYYRLLPNLKSKHDYMKALEEIKNE